MGSSFSLDLFIVALIALVGGLLAKKMKLGLVIGFVLSGVMAGSLFPIKGLAVERLSEIGATLLLFSIGLELSLNKFKGILNKILIASFAQMFLVSLGLFLILKVFGFENVSAIVLAVGFSLSSTAVVVKMLFDRGENETVHGKLMIGWLLVQDLAVIPLMVILPLIGKVDGGILIPGLLALSKSLVLVVVSVLLGKTIVPFLIHKVALVNSRELLLLTSVVLALGASSLALYFGLSAALGAFIAGFVISESQENHAVFAETRPLRDLFVAIFFVTLGFFVTPSVVFANLFKILAISILVIVVKIILVLGINRILKINGKTNLITALGLSQVGEFAFILFGTANSLGIIPDEISSIGVSVGLVTLMLTPIIYSNSVRIWKGLKTRFKFLSSYETNTHYEGLSDHIIILGFGRVGGWVGKALMDNNIDFVVIDYDREIISSCKSKGIKAIYGDPAEKEVLEVANLSLAKAVVLAIPDRISQESVIAHIQTSAPNVKIISRVHLDEDWEKLKTLRVDKLVQPEFEAAASIIKDIFMGMGKSKDEIQKNLKSIRLSHSRI